MHQKSTVALCFITFRTACIINYIAQASTCLALADDLCKCKVSPNIRAGVSTEEELPEGEVALPGDSMLLPAPEVICSLEVALLSSF